MASTGWVNHDNTNINISNTQNEHQPQICEEELSQQDHNTDNSKSISAPPLPPLPATAPSIASITFNNHQIPNTMSSNHQNKDISPPPIPAPPTSCTAYTKYRVGQKVYMKHKYDSKKKQMKAQIIKVLTGDKYKICYPMGALLCYQSEIEIHASKLSSKRVGWHHNKTKNQTKLSLLTQQAKWIKEKGDESVREYVAFIVNKSYDLRGSKRLPMFYLIDSIVTAHGQPFIKMFDKYLPDMMTQAYQFMDQTHRHMMDQLLLQWTDGDIFPQCTLKEIKDSFYLFAEVGRIERHKHKANYKGFNSTQESLTAARDLMRSLASSKEERRKLLKRKVKDRKELSIIMTKVDQSVDHDVDAIVKHFYSLAALDVIPVLYTIHGICRENGPFVERFDKHIHQMINTVYPLMNKQNKDKVYQLFKLWTAESVFPQDTLTKIAVSLASHEFSSSYSNQIQFRNKNGNQMSHYNTTATMEASQIGSNRFVGITNGTSISRMKMMKHNEIKEKPKSGQNF